MRLRYLVPFIYIVFLMLPIYWLLNMSFKTTNEILGQFTLWPRNFTLDNYAKIFSDPTWYWGYINSLIYVVINTAFRFRLHCRRLCFFTLPFPRRQASVLLALVQPHGSAGGFRAAISSALFGRRAIRHAHRCRPRPYIVQHSLGGWILEGFMSGVPKELDETAYVDGYSFWRFFMKIFIPTIAAGIGVACFFCFMFSWVELLLAKTLTSVEAKPIAATMTRTASTSGYELGLLAAAGVLTIVPGAFVIYFVRNYIAKGFALGRV